MSLKSWDGTAWTVHRDGAQRAVGTAPGEETLVFISEDWLIRGT